MTETYSRRGAVYTSRVRDYLCAHCSEDVSADAVGRAFGLSESSLRRKLKQESGLRFQELRDQVRVERVQAVLSAEPDLKVEALTIAVGWRSRTTLYATVRRVTGLSLDELREHVALDERVS